jgi:hypothetical protein
MHADVQLSTTWDNGVSSTITVTNYNCVTGCSEKTISVIDPDACVGWNVPPRPTPRPTVTKIYEPTMVSDPTHAKTDEPSVATAFVTKPDTPRLTATVQPTVSLSTVPSPSELPTKPATRSSAPSDCLAASLSLPGSDSVPLSNDLVLTAALIPTRLFTQFSVFERTRSPPQTSELQLSSAPKSSAESAPSLIHRESTTLAASAVLQQSNRATASTGLKVSISSIPSNHFPITPYPKFSPIFHETLAFFLSDAISSVELQWTSGVSLSLTLTLSHLLSQSASAVRSQALPASGAFCGSVQFRASASFNGSPLFSFITGVFTYSNEFTPSALFNRSPTFSLSSGFAESDEFTPSALFNRSHMFSLSSGFAESDEFTPSAELPQNSQLSSKAAGAPNDQDAGGLGSAGAMGVAGGGLAAVAAVLLLLFLLKKKKKKEEIVEVATEDTMATTLDAAEFISEYGLSDGAPQDVHMDDDIDMPRDAPEGGSYFSDDGNASEHNPDELRFDDDPGED